MMTTATDKQIDASVYELYGLPKTGLNGDNYRFSVRTAPDKTAIRRMVNSEW
jgi:hypothetical protein